MEAIATTYSRVEGIATGVEAIAIRLEAIATRLEAIAIWLESILPTFSSLCSSGSPEATGAGSSRSVSWQTVSRGEGYCFHSRWFHSKHGHLWHFRSFFNCGIHNCSCIACLHSHTIGQLRRFNVHGQGQAAVTSPIAQEPRKERSLTVYIYIYHSKNFCRCLFGSCFPHGIYSSGSCSAWPTAANAQNTPPYFPQFDWVREQVKALRHIR